MKWLVGGFVLWLLLRGRLPLYASFVMDTTGTANPQNTGHSGINAILGQNNP